ncbi:hypothetical protein DRN93_01700 [archaeon]|nr:MAG: hypothetical protein DRN93_01700 [archaeon]
MPIRLTDEERVNIMGKILRLKRRDSLTLRNACTRYGVPPTSFPEFKKTVKRILTRKPGLSSYIDDEDKEYLWK